MPHPSLRFALVLLCGGLTPALRATTPAIDIGTQRELFVDDALTDRLTGGAQLRLHHPDAREAAIVHDAPWEGNDSMFHTVFKDGDLYRMYYRGWQVTVTPTSVDTEQVPVMCYAESTDGIHWRKPELGLQEFHGSKANNILLLGGKFAGVNVRVEGTAVFKDENPAAAPDARYKTLLNSVEPHGLLAFKSPDGLHWSPMSTTPVMTGPGFDSQNLAFWDPAIGAYRAYWRPVLGEVKGTVRGIRTATSKDFLHWEHEADLAYGSAPLEHLYTNVVKPYYRAPQLLLGFPTRYVDRGWSDTMRALPDATNRVMRAKEHPRYGTAVTETAFMAGRDGVTFKRWPDAFIRPGIERPGTWQYGEGYTAWQFVETKSALPGAPNELSFYVSEGCWVGQADTMRRYTLRIDGFVSLEAPIGGGEWISKPLRFSGKQLSLNLATSAVGSVQVEIEDEDGKPLPGYALADCQPTYGDTLARTVAWQHGADVSALANRPVRLKFVVQEGDLYSFQFQP